MDWTGGESGPFYKSRENRSILASKIEILGEKIAEKYENWTPIIPFEKLKNSSIHRGKIVFWGFLYVRFLLGFLTRIIEILEGGADLIALVLWVS
jgi:hypothetical protein